MKIDLSYSYKQLHDIKCYFQSHIDSNMARHQTYVFNIHLKFLFQEVGYNSIQFKSKELYWHGKHAQTIKDMVKKCVNRAV